MAPKFKLIDFYQIAPDRKLSGLSGKEKVQLIDSLVEPAEGSSAKGLQVSWYLSILKKN